MLFVGTKKQCQEAIKEEAERVGQPYVATAGWAVCSPTSPRLSKRIKRLHELRKLVEDGSLDLLPTREAMGLRADLAKLETNLGGVADMERLPAPCSSSTRAKKRSSSKRRASSKSRSSPSSTPTATRTRSTTSSRATTTPSARARDHQAWPTPWPRAGQGG